MYEGLPSLHIFLKTDTGQCCVMVVSPVLFGILWPLIGRSMAGSVSATFGPNFPINRWPRPPIVIRSRFERVRFVHSSPLSPQKRLRLPKNERRDFQSLQRGRGIRLQIDTGSEDGFDSSTAPEDRW
jgi:hypothetical protein